MDRPRLSAAEIETLLPGSVPPEKTGDGEALVDTLSATAVEALRSIFVDFAAACTSELAEPLRGETDFQLGAIQEVTPVELSARMGQLTCLLILQLPPIAQQVLIELPYNTFFPLLDRLLGGGQHPSPTMRRHLTRIERRLAVRIANPLMAAMSQAWSSHTALEPKLEAIECDPRVVPLDTWDDRLVLVQMNVTVPVYTGACYVAFQRSDIDSAQRLLQLGPYAKFVEPAAESIPGKGPHQLTAVIGDALVDATQLESDSLAAGQVLWTDCAPDDPVLLYQGGQLKYVAEKGLQHGRKAARVLKVID